MIWTIDNEIRDQYSMGVHRDILIVPHATKVTPVAGGPPIIENKRPVFEYVKNSTYPDGMWIPKKENGQFVLDDVDWVIDNSILIKEKFKYSHTLNSDDNLTFSSCNAAMVQFTIRNKKEYIEELNDDDQPTGEYYWESEIPNLQNYEFVKKASDGTEKEIIGELEGNMIIKVYTYINGDSSNMVCLGMFRVEEDKVVGNGYERQITAYDFMATFRDMDIFYWYKHLFDGINMATNDYEEYTKSDRTKNINKDDETAAVNYIRQPKAEWTIKEALVDLIDNLASYDMIVWEKELDDKGQETGKMICKKGMTINNPSEYGRDYEEGSTYSGYGMPVMIDEDILTSGNEPYTPEEPGENEFERYGYMNILDMPFVVDPDIINKESLSMGKFLEDIGRLAGRYPVIRRDKFDEHDYIDPTESIEENKNCYNNYERCILTFKPLPSSKDDSKLKNIPETSLSNHEIMKGFEHESYMVDDIEIVTAKLNDKTEVSYHRLNKSQRVSLSKGGVGLQTYTFSDNMFCSYLVKSSDKEDIKSQLEKYAELRKTLFGKEYKSKNMTTDALFYQGYGNMRHRSYRPYKLTTYADPCRDVGDRIQITFEDKVTGEQVTFYSYILERSMEGIQKMMDTYEAKGDITNPIFSNYQTGSKYQSSSSFQVQSLGYNPTGTGGASGSQAVGISPSDLVQYWRNFGIRLLDEPSGCSAVFSGASDNSIVFNSHMYVTSSYPQETYIKDGDTTNPITVNGQEVTVTEGDYVRVKNYQNDDPAVPSTYYLNTVLYVYTANNKWELAESQWNGRTYLDVCGGYHEPTGQWQEDNDNLMVFLDHDDNLPIYNSDENIDEVEFTSYNLFIRPRRTDEPVNPDFPSWVGVGYYWKQKISKDTTNNKYAYGWADDQPEYLEDNPPGEKVYDSSGYVPSYGDEASIFTIDEEGGYKWYTWYTWQYPGFWLNHENKSYPLLDVNIEDSTKKNVQLKWSDPPDITDYKPIPATWEGTVIVRKENQAPLHRWDGEKVVRTTERDKYKTKPYKDEDIQANKVYYYGFFPYYTKISDPDHPIRFYTFTKVIRVETGVITYAPVIESIIVDGTNATITYSLIAPEGTIYTSVKLYAKIGDNPACDDTDDIVMDLDENETSVVVSDLQTDLYFFCIECIDNNDAEVQSNIESVDLGLNWDGSEITILWSGDNNRLTATLTDFGGDQMIAFIMYSGNDEIYQFFSLAQFWVSDEKPASEILKNINVGFIIDTNKQLAKPSFIYYICNTHDQNYQKYTYNNETYMTDAQMQAVYNWLLPGI